MSQTIQNLNIECIGYKKAFHGDKMWYFKATDKTTGQEYLIVDAGMINPLDMKWTKENKFENADFSDREQKELIIIMRDAAKSTVRLDDEDGENKFFTQHEQPIKMPKSIKPRIPGHYTEDEINKIFPIITDLGWLDEKCTFDKEALKQSPKLLRELEGYKVKFTTDGDHKNDGQMVEYTFTFTSPTGAKTVLNTEMCLMVGWNYTGPVIIN